MRQICPDTRLMVVDGQRLFRDAVRVAVAELCPQVEVVAEARNRREAVRLARRQKPDIALFSAKSSQEETLFILRSMRRAVPACRIVVLMDEVDPIFAFETVMAGSNGYLSRKCSSGELVLAIATARRDGVVMPRRHLSLAFTRLGHPDVIRLDQLTNQMTSI